MGKLEKLANIFFTLLLLQVLFLVLPFFLPENEYIGKIFFIAANILILPLLQVYMIVFGPLWGFAFLESLVPLVVINTIILTFIIYYSSLVFKKVFISKIAK